jgi:hypothetical protein
MINSEAELRESFKGKRRHCYMVGEYSFQQVYSPMIDAFRPYCVYVYRDGKNVGAGSGASIQESFNSLIISSIRFQQDYLDKSLKLSQKLEDINDLINEGSEDD